MQSTIFKTYEDKPFFPMILADEKSPEDKVFFLKTIKKSKDVEVKVYFTSAKIFLVHMKDNSQQKVEVRLRTPLHSLIGETSRLEEMH
jgi:hypothetical protein